MSMVDDVIASPLGIVVRYYPARLSINGLQYLIAAAGELEGTAPTFADWLTDWCTGEIARRLDAAAGDCREADLPHANHTMDQPRARPSCADRVYHAQLSRRRF